MCERESPSTPLSSVLYFTSSRAQWKYDHDHDHDQDHVGGDDDTWYPGAASGLTAAPFSPANAELLRPAPYKIIPMIFFSSIYHFCFQFIHLQDPLPSRPLPLPAAQAEPQGSLSSGPSGGPWPSPSWAPPSLWPPRPSSPQSLGIPITHQPHPSPPHCSETDQECESSEKEMFGKEKICNKMMEILSPSPHH